MAKWGKSKRVPTGTEQAEQRAKELRRNLQIIMDRHGLKAAEWCRRAGIPPSVLYNLFSGVSQSLALPTLKKLADVIGLTVGDITGDLGDISSVQSVPLLGVVEAGAFHEAPEGGVDDNEYVLVQMDAGRIKNAFALRVRGPSMNRLYPDGSTVICVPLEYYWSTVQSGDKVIIRKHYQGLWETTVKELAIDKDGKAWLWPRSDDPRHQAPIPVPWPIPEDFEIAITAIVLHAQKTEAAALR